MIFPLMLKAPRPSRVQDMKAALCRPWCPKGFSLTFFGYILTDTQTWADHLNSTFDAHKNHEMIHLRQAQATNDSWWLFYFKYVGYSLAALRHWRRIKRACYWLNPFEMEAYAHQHDLEYLEKDENKGGTEWRTLARMNITEKMDFLKKHKIGQN